MPTRDPRQEMMDVQRATRSPVQQELFHLNETGNQFLEAHEAYLHLEKVMEYLLREMRR